MIIKMLLLMNGFNNRIKMIMKGFFKFREILFKIIYWIF